MMPPPQNNLQQDRQPQRGRPAHDIMWLEEKLECREAVGECFAFECSCYFEPANVRERV